MAIFEITEGAPGQGKSLYTARLARRLCERNIKSYHKRLNKWEKAVADAILRADSSEDLKILQDKKPLPRLVFSNIRFSESFEEKYSDWVRYWADTQEVCKLNDVDLIWDEIATELDSRNYANLTVELKRFLSQYRKRGVDIYANTQDYSMIDRRARLMTTSVRTLTKLLGSSDISSTKEPPKHIWGIVLIRNVTNYKEDDPEKKKYELMPGIMWISRELVELYDTRQDIPMGKPAPLRHIELVCEQHGIPGHNCSFKKIVHQ